MGRSVECGDDGCCCDSRFFLKKLSIAFNVYYWFSGPACLGLGIWFLLIIRQLEPSLNPDEFSFSSYTMIGAGIAITLYGLIGCLAIFNEHRCLLGLFYVLLATSFAAQLASCLKLFLLYDTIESHVHYNLNISVRYKYSLDHEITEKLDSLQQEFTCCGVQNYTDWESSYYNNRIINNRIPERNVSYPGSCYVGGSNSNLNNLTNTDYKDVHIFKTGCASSVVSIVKKFCKVFGWPTFGMSAMQVIGGVILYCFRTAIS